MSLYRRPILAVVPCGSAVECILEKAGVPFACAHPDEAEGKARNAFQQLS
jgi:hypothetical protein